MLGLCQGPSALCTAQLVAAWAPDGERWFILTNGRDVITSVVPLSLKLFAEDLAEWAVELLSCGIPEIYCQAGFDFCSAVYMQRQPSSSSFGMRVRPMACSTCCWNILAV